MKRKRRGTLPALLPASGQHSDDAGDVESIVSCSSSSESPDPEELTFSDEERCQRHLEVHSSLLMAHQHQESLQIELIGSIQKIITFQQDLLVKKPRIKERDVITAGIERGLQELREAQNKLDELRKTVPALPPDLSSSKF